MQNLEHHEIRFELTQNWIQLGYKIEHLTFKKEKTIEDIIELDMLWDENRQIEKQLNALKV